jgi:hypothetical protein
MARIPVVIPEEASGVVRDIYEDIVRVEGEPHLLLQCFANDPEVLNVEWQMEKALMHGESSLPKKLRQYIGLTVSVLYGCGG